MTEDGCKCYYLGGFDWENGSIDYTSIGYTYEPAFSRELEGYIDNSDGIMRFGMQTKSEGIPALKFEFNEKSYDSYQAFQVYHFENKLFHISQEVLHGITYQTDIFADSFYEYYNDNLNRSIVLKTEDGVEIANADQVMTASPSGIGEQIDFFYNLEDLFKGYVEQDIYIFL